MLDGFLKYNKEQKLWDRTDRILLAVSGGIDSMVMAHLFIRTGIETGIAHCNFSLRGEESDKDEELVRKFANDHKIPFFSKRFETGDYSEKRKISIQMAARELRYEWFETVRNQNNYKLIAVAHNLNDNVETLLINLIRGTGIAGLTGMRPVSGRIIRPLLFATRLSIGEYCSLNNVRYREDKSNTETKYTRNKIRHLVIPLLKEINPSVEETLNETSERLAGTNEIVTTCIEEIKERIAIIENGNTVFNLKRLKEVGSNRAIIYELFSCYGINNSSSKDLINIINGKSGKQIMTKTHRIIKDRSELIVTQLKVSVQDDLIINGPTDFLKTTFIRSADIISFDSILNIPEDQHIAMIDLQKIAFPMVVRKWKRGDSFFPLGMKQKKKLSDYFIDRKFSLLRKEKTLILESKGDIIWIIGERIDERYKITSSTVKVLRIECKA